MLKLTPNPTFTAPVEIHVPGSGKIKVPFVFVYKDKDEYKAFTDEAASGKKEELDILLEIVKGWENCDIPYSPEALGTLLKKYHGSGPAIFAAYVNELTGARLGN